MKISNLLLLSVLILGLASCEKNESSHEGKTVGSIPIQGKIIFESPYDFVKDQAKSIYLWEAGKIKKIYTAAHDPKWSLDKTSIAASRSGNGNIIIINEKGELQREVKTGFYAVDVGWMDKNNIFYVGTTREKISKPSKKLIHLNLVDESETTIYETSPVGLLQNVSYYPDRRIFVAGLLTKLEGESDLRSRVVTIDYPTAVMKILYEDARSPILDTQNDNIYFKTNLYPNGESMNSPVGGYICKLNLRTQELQKIRPVGLLRSMKLSRDEKYLYTSEQSETSGAQIYIFNIKNLINPIFTIEPRRQLRTGDWSQMVHPDWVY